MEQYLESLNLALKSLKIADHIIYVTYPVIKDKKLLLKSLDSLYESLIYMINAVLQYDYMFKRIKLYEESHENFRTFTERCAKRYNITNEEIDEIKKLISLAEKHKKSSVEFQRNEKVILMSESLSTTPIDMETMKKSANLIKIIFSKIKDVLVQR
jgi:hypothetical protein